MKARGVLFVGSAPRANCAIWEIVYVVSPSGEVIVPRRSSVSALLTPFRKAFSWSLRGETISVLADALRMLAQSIHVSLERQPMPSPRNGFSASSAV